MTDLTSSHTVLPFPTVKDSVRLNGLDWLRVGATLAVVMLHAGIPYMAHTLPELIWASYSPVRSDAVDLICWGIDGFIMPLFFIMSGYFAADLFHKQGANGFLMHRIKRIGGPFVFGAFFVLPLSLYVWITGWVIAGMVPFHAFYTFTADRVLKQSILGPAHLWYLSYLLIFCLGMWVLSKLTSKVSQRPSLGWSCLGVLAGLSVMCVTLNFYPRIVIGFRNSLFPMRSSLVYYSIPFTLGWYWNRFPLTTTPKSFKTVQPPKQWWGLMAVGMVLFACLWPNLIEHLEADTSLVSNAAVPVLFVAYGMTMACALFGLALNWKAPTPPNAIRYCAKASLWVYLFHHPVVCLTQLTLMDWNISIEMKFLASTVITVALCLLSYEVLGRRTWAAVMLNGRRDLPRVIKLESDTDVAKAA